MKQYTYGCNPRNVISPRLLGILFDTNWRKNNMNNGLFLPTNNYIKPLVNLIIPNPTKCGNC